MLSFKSNPFSLAFLPLILDNQLMHQHNPINCIVKNGEAIVSFNDLFEDYRSGFVDLIRIQDDPFGTPDQEVSSSFQDLLILG
jgi:hypothetical protein